jgi:Zn-dependent peptidase ImmA (M78 family)
MVDVLHRAKIHQDRRSHEDKVMDEEANVFAMLLLMPNPQFVQAMRGVPDLLDEEAVKKVAKIFQVGVPMVICRWYLEEKLRRR